VPDRPDRRALADLLAPARPRLVVAAVLQLVASALAVGPLVAVVEIARSLVEGASDGHVWRVAAAGAAAQVVGILATSVAGALTHLADNDLQLVLRRRLGAHLRTVPLGWFSERSAGEVKSAVLDDVGAIHHLVGHAVTDMVDAVTTVVVFNAYLLWVDWRLALLAAVPTVLGHTMLRRMPTAQSEAYADFQCSMLGVNAASVELVEGITVVKVFGVAGRAHRRFLDATTSFVTGFRAVKERELRGRAVAGIVMSPLLTLTVVLAFAALFVSRGWTDPIDVVPFALLAMGIARPLFGLSFARANLQQARAAAGRIIALLATPPLPEPVQPTPPDGERITFEGVHFAYGETQALRGVDLVLEPGTVTALVGPSGAGKSTIARLLPRFWDPTEGRITLGGVDLRDVGSEELHRHVGFVFQDVQLLRTTVRENIALARPDATDAEVEAAARAAQVHDRIARLPGGYGAIVGEEARFSGGEAQRLSIARALLADTPVLVLDEATAFADPESEAAIQRAIAELVAGRTLLVIAHRLQTVVGADQIAVVDGGRIVESGRHDDLLAHGGRYRALWDAHERAEASA
jgi:ATP-binding cassette subfamily B protein